MLLTPAHERTNSLRSWSSSLFTFHFPATRVWEGGGVGGGLGSRRYHASETDVKPI